jgi:hypothetical protein
MSLLSRFVLAGVLAASLGLPACGGYEATFGPPTKLAFTVQPASGPAGALAAIRVEVRDAEDRLVTSATHTVTVTLNAAVGMAGQATVNAVGGVATFSGLFIITPGAGYTLTASNPLLGSVMSTAFTIGAP